MQKIGWILAILCAVCWFASELSLPSEGQTVSPKAESEWRRTVDGWEKVNEWNYPIEKPPRILHPGVIGFLMVAISLSVGIAAKEPGQ